MPIRYHHSFWSRNASWSQDDVYYYGYYDCCQDSLTDIATTRTTTTSASPKPDPNITGTTAATITTTSTTRILTNTITTAAKGTEMKVKFLQ